jgi:hypothetical protein
MPLRRRVLLVDLSNNNPSPIDFKAMRKAGCYGVLLKVSEGTSFVRTLLYTYPAFLSEQHWSQPLGTGAGLWIAAYGPNDGHDHGVPPGSIAPWHRFAAHQFTSVGRIAGVAGHVDLSHASSRRQVLAHGWRGLR